MLSFYSLVEKFTINSLFKWGLVEEKTIIKQNNSKYKFTE